MTDDLIARLKTQAAQGPHDHNLFCEAAAALRKSEADLKAATEIVDRVWKALGITTYEQANGNAIDEIVSRQRETIGKLREALQTIVDGIPVVRATPYRTDGVPSKCDKCPHGQFIYEGCEECVSDFARAALSDTNGVPVAEPTVAGRKDEPSGEGESRLGNGLSPQADAGEEPEGDLKAAREANRETIGRADDKRIKSLTGTISRQRETIGKLRRALVTCHAELVAEVQIHYEKLANPDPKYRYEASMGAILKARAILSDLDVEGDAGEIAKKLRRMVTLDLPSLDLCNRAASLIERQAAEIRQLRSDLNGRLGQPFGDPAKS